MSRVKLSKPECSPLRALFLVTFPSASGAAVGEASQEVPLVAKAKGGAARRTSGCGRRLA